MVSIYQSNGQNRERGDGEGVKGGLLNRIFPENNRPELLKHPADAVVVSTVCPFRPQQHFFVVASRPCEDLLTTYDELGAANISDKIRNLVARDTEDLHVNLGEGVPGSHDGPVESFWSVRVKAYWAAGMVRTAQVDVSVGVDRFEAELCEGIDSFRAVGKDSFRSGTDDVVVPLLRRRVGEDGVLRQGIVVVENVRQVDRGFAAGP